MSRYLFLLLLCLFCKKSIGQKKVWVHFENIANGKEIVLNDSTYKNKYGETYTITKLKYYISNLKLVCNTTFNMPKLLLIDINKKEAVLLKNRCRACTAISFTVGIDSAINAYGVQGGVLDPLNDMYWAWNSGYVNFKLEGKSNNSLDINNKVEQHIGGYKGIYKTMQNIILPIKKFSQSVTIQMNLDEYWNNIKITETAIITSPGPLAKIAADNFVKMFTIKNEN